MLRSFLVHISSSTATEKRTFAADPMKFFPENAVLHAPSASRVIAGAYVLSLLRHEWRDHGDRGLRPKTEQAWRRDAVHAVYEEQRLVYREGNPPPPPPASPPSP